MKNNKTEKVLKQIAAAHGGMERENTAASGYRETMRVVKQEDLRDQMLADALAELQAFRDNYAALKELAEVFEAISRVRK